VEGIRGEKQKKNEKQKTDSYENIISRDAQLSEVLLDLLKHGLAMTVFQTLKKKSPSDGIGAKSVDTKDSAEVRPQAAL
jgi:hypothetical protein